MFDDWSVELLGYRTLIAIDREVLVYTGRLFPSAGDRRDSIAMWIKSGGLHLEPWMPGRQTAWLKLDTGGWMAIVDVPAFSGNRLSRVAMQLWVLPQDLKVNVDGA